MSDKKEVKISDARREEIFLKIRPLVAKGLNIAEEKVTLEAEIIDDLGADSLDVIGVVMALEEAFDIEIMDEDQEKIKTVNDIVEYLVQRVKQ